MAAALFTRDGDAFVPTAAASSPWSADALHGGPPSALLARAIERHVDDPAMQVTRLTFDLFRAVPQAPLRVHAETVRGGRRIHVVQASLVANGVEVSRATGLLLRRTEEADGDDPEPVPPPPGPAGLESTTGIGRRPRSSPDANGRSSGFRPRFEGFHTHVESRWVTAFGHEAPPTVWLRVPMPVVEGELTTPVMRAAALSDFGNAIANQGLGLSGTHQSFINADITLYLHRDPVGEWLCLQGDSRRESAGVGFVDSHWYDEGGRYGRGVQSRLLNSQ